MYFSKLILVNKFTYLLNQRKNNYINLAVYSRNNYNIFLNSKAVYISKPIISLKVSPISISNKTSIVHDIGSLLKSSLTMRSSMFVFSGKSIGVYSLTVHNYPNLHVNVLRLNEVGFLPKNGYFNHYDSGFKLTSNNIVKAEKSNISAKFKV